MNALIFDCDGVLADTERDGHLPAFNAAFTEFGLPVRWSQAEYGEKVLIGGGKERLASTFTPEFLRAHNLPGGDGNVIALVAKLHKRKTELFKEIVAAGRLAPRPGIARVARGLFDRGWKLGVASTSALESVRAVLVSVVGETLASEFVIFAGDMVPRKKPAPDIYLYALDELGIAPSDAVVVEDSRNGLLAAGAAGIRCVVTLSSYTQNEVMDAAVLVVSSLGDPGLPPIEVRANRIDIKVSDYVTVDDFVTIAGAPTLSVKQ